MVEAMQRGAYDFITKPFNKEPLLRAVHQGLERNRLIRENRHLRLRVADTAGFAGLVGQSPPMRRLFEKIQAIAPTDYAVIIRGESGTGKELVARAIHALSKRQQRPLVTVSCPAIPETSWKASSSVTGAGPSPAPTVTISAYLKKPTTVPCSWMKSAISRSPSKPNSCRSALQEQEIKPLGASKTLKSRRPHPVFH